MPLECLTVVLTLVAKEVAEGLDPDARRDQPLPIVMPNLMTEVTEKSAVWLLQLQPPFLPFCVVCLGYVQGNYPLAVPSEYWGGLRQIGEKLIGQALYRVTDFILKR